MNRINWRFLLLRLSEAGTWRGILIFLGVMGLKLSDPMEQAIVGAGCGIAFIMQTILAELASPPVTHDQIKAAVADALAAQPLSVPADTAPARLPISVTTIGQKP